MTITRLGNRKEKKRTKYNVRLAHFQLSPLTFVRHKNNRFPPDKSSYFEGYATMPMLLFRA